MKQTTCIYKSLSNCIDDELTERAIKEAELYMKRHKARWAQVKDIVICRIMGMTMINLITQDSLDLLEKIKGREYETCVYAINVDFPQLSEAGYVGLYKNSNGTYTRIW